VGSGVGAQVPLQDRRTAGQPKNKQVRGGPFTKDTPMLRAIAAAVVAASLIAGPALAQGTAPAKTGETYMKADMPAGTVHKAKIKKHVAKMHKHKRHIAKAKAVKHGMHVAKVKTVKHHRHVVKAKHLTHGKHTAKSKTVKHTKHVKNLTKKTAG
jgi:hypothetical protein